MEGNYRAIERRIYRNPIINIEDFPTVDECTLRKQEYNGRIICERYGSACYAYIKELNNSWYIDIYIYYEIMLYHEIGMKRFVILPGHQMPEKEEEEFLYLLKNECFLVNFENCDSGSFVEQLDKVAPELHIKNYDDAAEILMHAYFASYRCGVRELLYKAGGLDKVAWSIDDIDGWNVVAKNIEQAFDMPIKLLRKMNWTYSYKDILNDKVHKKQAVNMYKKYHNILNDVKTINELQFYYLIDCMEHDEEVDKKELSGLKEIGNLYWNDAIYDYVDGEDIYIRFKDYLAKRSQVTDGEAIFPRYPGVAFERYYMLLYKFVENEDAIHNAMSEYKYRCIPKFTYEDDEYAIVIPSSVKDFIDEANRQHSCLKLYISKVLEGETTIVFMRRRERPEKSYVTVEICNGAIIQARRKFNEDISDEDRAFLIKYAREKNLRLSLQN